MVWRPSPVPFPATDGDKEFPVICRAVCIPLTMPVHHEAGFHQAYHTRSCHLSASRARPDPGREEQPLSPLQRFNTRTDYCHLHMEEGTVIKPQDNPPDDLYADLSEIVAEIIRHMPGHERARIIGYTIISPGPVLPPLAFRVNRG